MRQVSLMAYVKPKKAKKRAVYIFQMDFPEGIMTPDGPIGPFKRMDMVNEELIHPKVLSVLLSRGAVKPYVFDENYPRRC